jgi:hypothetical protein
MEKLVYKFRNIIFEFAIFQQTFKENGNFLRRTLSIRLSAAAAAKKK